MKRISIIIFFIAIAGTIAGAVWYQLASSPPGGDQELKFSIERGENLKSISRRLYESGLIKSKFLFEQYARWRDLAGRLQAGDYKLNTGQSLSEIAASLLSAKRESKRVLIKEGETVEEIAKVFADSGLFGAREFLQAAVADQNLKNRYVFLSDLPIGATLEGFLFPDTYDFFVGVTPQEAIKKMLDNFSRKVPPEMIETMKAQGKTLYEIITLASIVEREVRKPEDMKIAAGIFWSRLGRGQALQSDATLSYVLNDTEAAHSAADLEINSPYNTYKYPGLPPTPINNPGLNAINAVFQPTATKYNFFLTSPDGTVYYAETFEGHVANKVKYLRKK
jgi:UPF0755 protein